MKPLRLRPGVILGVLLALLWFVLPAVLPDDYALYALGGAVGSVLLILIWWLFFSRAPWLDRLGAILFAVVAVIVTKRLVHVSIAGGAMGYLLYVYAVPVLSLALVAGAAVGRRLSRGGRRAAMAGVMLLACASLLLIRTDGMYGARAEIRWRWTPTAEDRLLARTAGEPDPTPPAPVAAPADMPGATTGGGRIARPGETGGAAVSPSPSTEVTHIAEWPGFRGPGRDSVVRGVRIDTDWSTSPPAEIWRKPIGPGWSSFAVDGTRIYTQEQRGEDEIVSCYDLATGAPVWRHRDKARFWESNAGPGPRATPTLSRGRVYTFGATGILNALDARTGAVVWSRNAASDTKKETPMWAFAGSPLVVGDLVAVATAGVLAAYDLDTGRPRWISSIHGAGYSSPHVATIAGVTQIVLLNGDGAIGVVPADGTVLWTHAWNTDGIVQPAVMDGGDVLIGSGSGLAEVGVRRIGLTRRDAGWTVQERWTSTGLKPYFNDFVVHKGHAYGVDSSILACIDLTDGKRAWKGGRYGAGQVLLLADQDVLLVVSEDGDLALVSATPDQFTELARVAALEGKTWNHPVLVGDVLLVRNGEEMAAFRLKLAGR